MYRRQIDVLSRSNFWRTAIFICFIGMQGLVFGDTPNSSPKPTDLSAWKNFWSFQPIASPVPPKVADPRWATNPIDQFIFDRLTRERISPTHEADRATLIRRATFDLLGLPPTVPEIHAFVTDSSPDACEKLIDRLLASPHYGERWGEHWLDVARYVPGRINFIGISHTSGDQAYRDYVVRAFNTDKPFDRFVTEQLAGDLLPPSGDRQQEFDQIIAPAFLSIGSWFDEETDPNRLRMEIIDDQICTTSSAMLGLTVGCARCHDHKFDPIPTRDYYAMAGIFGSTRVIDQLNNYWRDGRTRLLRPLATTDEVAQLKKIDAEIDQLKTARWSLLSGAHEAFVSQWKPRDADYRRVAAQLPRTFCLTFKAENFDGEHNLRIAQLSKDGVGVNVLETLIPVDEWADYKISVPADGSYLIEAYYTADGSSPLLLEVNGSKAAESALTSSTGGWDLQYERWETMAQCDMQQGLNFVRLTVKQGSFPRIDRLRIRRVSPEIHKQITQLASDQKLDPMLLERYSIDASDPWPSIGEMAGFVSPSDQSALSNMATKIGQLESSRPPYELAITVADEPKCADMPIHVRGDVYQTTGLPVPRGALSVLQEICPTPAIPGNESGRLELAHWMTDPRNPLTARVIANRIWQWHFGRGLVASSSDFGSRGDLPTHPELLDYLAHGLIEHGWSIKWLQKQIMISQTYRQAGPAEPSESAGTAVDPENKLLWSFPRQRLDAQELYDAMLCSGNLLLPQPATGPLDVEKAKNRAMYVLASNRAPKGLGPEIRKMFPLFDDDAMGKSIAVRPVSVTPAQGLFWLNSPIVAYFAGRFAERLLKMDKLDDSKRVEMAYRIALGHLPANDVLTGSVSFVRDQEQAGQSPQQAWAQLCQAIFASDEFHYVD